MRESLPNTQYKRKDTMAKNILVLDSHKWQKPNQNITFVLPDHFLNLVAFSHERVQTGSVRDMILYIKPFTPYFLNTKHDLNAIHTFLEELWTIPNRPYTIFMVLQNPDDANSCLLDTADDVIS